MKKSFKKVLTSLLCGTMLLSMGFSAAAAENVGGKYTFVPGAVSTTPSIMASDEEAPATFAQGDPSDCMRFYSIKSYPSVMRISDGATGTLPQYFIGINSAHSMGTGDYFSGSFNEQETTNLYADIRAKGFEVLGWNTESHFRFDFSNPSYYTYKINNGTTVRAEIPSNHTPYQTYLMNFYTPISSDTSSYYASSWGGTVYCSHNGISNWPANFYTCMGFNSP